jgi:hypothetical protein
MFVVVYMMYDEPIKEGSEQECKIFVDKLNSRAGTDIYTYTSKKDYAA